MPRVPANQSSGGGLLQIPGVYIPESGIPAGFGVLGAGLQDLGTSVSRAGLILQQAKKRETAEEAQKAVSQYTAELTGLWGGRPDPVTGEMRPGLRHLDPSDPDGASKKLAEWQKNWRDAPDGAYAKLSPEARRLFDTEAQAVYSRFGNLAVDKDFDAKQSMRDREREAFISTQLGMAQQFHFDGAKFAEAEQAASRAIAAAKVGPGLLNPEEKDPDKMRFASEAFRQQFETERKAASEAMRADRAKTMISAARTLNDDGMAGERLGVAREIAKGLSPKDGAAVLELAAEAEGHRKAVKTAEALEKRRLASEQAAALDAAGDLAKYRFFRGDFDSKRTFDEADRLVAQGWDGGKATELREFVLKNEAQKADAAALSRETFARAGRGDTAAYLALMEDVSTGREPWRTEERLLAAAKSGALEQEQFKRLYDQNRKGLDDRTQKAVTAALAAAAGLEPSDAEQAFSRDGDASGSAAGRKAMKRLTDGLAYDYDRPWRADIGRKALTVPEFDGLVEGARLFIETHPDKDVLEDYLKPMLKPKADQFRAKTLAERLAAGRAELAAAQDEMRVARERRVSRMANEYLSERKTK